jgi:hypothetical protein
MHCKLFMTDLPPLFICYGSEIPYCNFVIVCTVVSDLTIVLVSLW